MSRNDTETKREEGKKEQTVTDYAYVGMIINVAGLCLGLVQTVGYFMDPNGKKDILLSIIGVFLVGLSNCLWLLLYGMKKIIPAIINSILYIVFALVTLILYAMVF